MFSAVFCFFKLNCKILRNKNVRYICCIYADIEAMWQQKNFFKFRTKTLGCFALYKGFDGV